MGMEKDPLPQLEDWRRDGRIAPLDAHFGRFVARGSGHAALGLLAAVVSRQRSLGHVCLDARQLPEDLPGPELEAAWRAVRSLDSPWLGRGPGAWSPLVLDGARLYLGRMHAAECRVAGALRRRLEAPDLPPPRPEHIRALFPGDGPGIDGQRLAAVIAALRPFALITGGPGTGKTTTVLRVLALRLLRQPELAIHLLAPTGKAAARLTESLRAQRSSLAVPGLDPARIPDRVSTVHHFLGLGRGRPRYDRRHPAPVDLVVLDEASMIDLPTMDRLLEALPETAGLLLLGDPHQLASVEAGSVLADLVEGADPRAFSPAMQARLRALGVPLPEGTASGSRADDALVALTWSHRFPPDRGIGKLAAAVRSGTASWEEVEAIAAQHPEIELLTWQGKRLPPGWLDGFVEPLDNRTCTNLPSALRHLGRARVLCALRSGPAGVETLNQVVAERLAAKRGGQPSLHGTPVLVTRNAPALGLYNGDMGVLWAHETATGERRVRACFLGPDGEIHCLPRAELPEHEPAYALTVHKSQGSEYDRVLLVLPDTPHPLVTRELLYTALTRARRAVRILAGPETWDAGVNRRTQRASGLTERLRAR
ncbi:MAG: exodeoxyribonuclease V subunit alpha [Gammaproteobacteria bacterium]|nr:MAG: exodeoxyribonuclease V subunit alpha [Gammaproteobacteria bacterium]